MAANERVHAVTVRPTTLLEAGSVALASDEIRQVRGTMRDRGDGRCACGVFCEVVMRAGYSPDGAWFEALDPDFGSLQRAAAKQLGFSGLDEANDAGVALAWIGQALRAARAVRVGG